MADNKKVVSYQAKLLYTNNVCRKEIGTISYRLGDAMSDVFLSVLSKLETAGYPFHAEKGQLYIKYSDKFVQFDSVNIMDTDDIAIIYSEIIAPNNAARFTEIDGIEFIFHTNEKNHMYFPHVHARYGGCEICISLDGFQVTGHLDSPTKEKQAKNFVRENQQKFYDEWYRIIDELR